MPHHYHILSIDGGGIRGLLACVILERLEAAHPGFLDQVDLFAGTSTGAIVAMGLAAGRTPAQVRELYESMGGQVFSRSWRRRLRCLGNTLGAKYGNEALKQEICNQVGELTLGELPKKVLVAAFDLDNNPLDPGRVRAWKPKFFNNFQETDLEERVVDVIVRSTAAPTLFPSHQGYIDGGVVANNPSVAAIAQALDQETGNQRLEDLVLLSLGTGQKPRYLSQWNANWGWLRWAPHMLNLMLEGHVRVAHYECSRLLGQRYYRLDPVLPGQVAKDDPAAMADLKHFAAELDLVPAVDWLRAHFDWEADRTLRTI